MILAFPKSLHESCRVFAFYSTCVLHTFFFLQAVYLGLTLSKPTKICGGAGHRSPYLSHAKRALYHLSYTPTLTTFLDELPIQAIQFECLKFGNFWLLRPRARTHRPNAPPNASSRFVVVGSVAGKSARRPSARTRRLGAGRRSRRHKRQCKRPCDG